MKEMTAQERYLRDREQRFMTANRKRRQDSMQLAAQNAIKTGEPKKNFKSEKEKNAYNYFLIQEKKKIASAERLRIKESHDTKYTHSEDVKLAYQKALASHQTKEAYDFHNQQIRKLNNPVTKKIHSPGYKPMTQDTHNQLVDAGFLR